MPIYRPLIGSVRVTRTRAVTIHEEDKRVDVHGETEFLKYRVYATVNYNQFIY